jgi:hypothetical protein
MWPAAPNIRCFCVWNKTQPLPVSYIFYVFFLAFRRHVFHVTAELDVDVLVYGWMKMLKVEWQNSKLFDSTDARDGCLVKIGWGGKFVCVCVWVFFLFWVGRGEGRIVLISLPVISLQFYCLVCVCFVCVFVCLLVLFCFVFFLQSWCCNKCASIRYPCVFPSVTLFCHFCFVCFYLLFLYYLWCKFVCFNCFCCSL